MERNLRVLDGAVAVFDGKEGVEPQSEQVWRQADKYDVPRICFVNKMDKIGADFYFSVRTMEERLGANAVPIQLPIGAESEFEGIVDLVEMNAKVWRGETKLGETYETIDIPADLQDKAEEYRTKLLEVVAETDEDLLEKYVGGEEITVEEIKGAIRKLTIASEIYPVLCGSAFKNKGVQPMLDAVRLPAVAAGRAAGHRPRPGKEDEEIVRTPSTDEPFAALAFKIATHPFFGKLTYIRVYSGKVDSGAQVINATKGKKERLGKLFQMHSNKENPVDSASAGHIYAVIGLKDTTTGDTLADPNKQVVLESMTFPAGDRGGHRAQDQERPGEAVPVDPEARRGGSDLQGAPGSRDRPDRDRRHGRAAPGHPGGPDAPRVQGRGQRRQAAGGLQGDHQAQGRQGRVHPQEADRWLGPVREGAHLPEPFSGEDGATYEFENKVTGGRIPREYIPSVDAGAQDAMQYGVLAGYPLVNLKVTLLDGAYHDVDSSEMAFKIAGSQALKKAAGQAQPVILEPIMAVEVTTPEDYMGDVIGDLNSAVVRSRPWRSAAVRVS